MDLERVVIVGASLAGLAAAAALRDGGWDGHLVMVESASELPTDRPPLSKGVLSGAVSPDAIPQPRAGDLDDLDVDLVLGRRVEGFGASDLRLKYDNDHELTADGVVIATGAAPRRLPDTDHLSGVHVVRTLDDSLALRADLDDGPRRVVVVGAGFIGAEVAATARGMGHEVTVIEAADRPLAAILPGTVGDAIGAFHAAHGVTLRCGVGVDGLRGDDAVRGVALADGEVLDADVVVVGIGVIPNTAWLSGSGLDVDDGVMCDETLLAAPGVVAAGDVARWTNPLFGESMRVEHWDHALAMGTAAGRRLLQWEADEEGTPFSTVPWFWSDQYDHKIQMAGRPRPTDEVVELEGAPGDERFAVAFRRDGRCTGVLAVDRPRAVVMARMKMETSLDWAHVIGDDR